MIIGMSLDEETSVELDVDLHKGTPEAAKFIIGQLSTRMQARIRDRATLISPNQDDGGGQPSFSLSVNEANLETVRFGLRDWSGIRDPNGNEIKLTHKTTSIAGRMMKVVAEDMLELIPLAWVTELAGKINSLSRTTDIERKN